jgi:predicted nucleic acid-binding protein
MIVDTTFLIDLEREVAHGQEGPAMAFLAGHTAEPLRISVVTYGELAEGYNDLESPALGELIAPYVILEVNQPIGKRYAAISRTLRSSGDRWGDNDLWIAATALEAREPLVTRDRDHFSRISGLMILGY